MCHQSASPSDFIVECTSRPKPSEEGSWNLFVDGSSSKAGCGAGLLILDQGNRIEYAIKFDFAVSNNGRLEALVLGVQLRKTAGARKLKAHSNS